MDEQDFRILITLADTGNLTKTAERLFMAQPTLSKRLQNIENDLHAQLFLRSKQGLTLTSAGESVLKTVRSVSSSVDAMRAQIQNESCVVSGVLSVAVSLDYSRYCLPDVLEEYTRAYPAVTLKVNTTRSSHGYKKLAEGQCHVAILRGEYPWEGGKMLLTTERVCLIRSREDQGKDLSQLRYICRYAGDNHMSPQTQWLIEHNLNPQSTLNVDDLSTCVDLTRRGIGWSIVPEICLHSFDGIVEPLCLLDGTPLTRNTYVLYRKKEIALAQVRTFVDAVCAYAKR